MPSYLSKIHHKTFLYSVLLTMVAVLAVTMLAKAKDQDFYLECGEINSCNLILQSGNTRFTLKRYTTEPVFSCTSAMGQDCELRLSIVR